MKLPIIHNFPLVGFTLNNLALASGVNDEISTLSASLDMLKQRAEDTIKVHAESQKKDLEGSPRVFDPAVRFFTMLTLLECQILIYLGQSKCCFFGCPGRNNKRAQK